MVVFITLRILRSFLLTTIYLFCLVHKIRVRAAAPTGIAAANIDVPGTDVTASTLHALLELDGSLHSKLDFGKLDDAKVAMLMHLQVLMLDEVSMLDENAWKSIASVLSIIDHNRRPNDVTGSSLGDIHVNRDSSSCSFVSNYYPSV